MTTLKHAYYYTSNGSPAYAQYEIPYAELLLAIANKQVILLNDIHPYVKQNDPGHMLIAAYIFNFKTGEISFDIEIVKNVLMQYIKNTRNTALRELDTEQLKCMTNPDKLARIENVKQQLRDLPILLTKSMITCDNFGDLRHVIPPILTTYKEMI